MNILSFLNVIDNTCLLYFQSHLFKWWCHNVARVCWEVGGRIEETCTTRSGCWGTGIILFCLINKKYSQLFEDYVQGIMYIETSIKSNFWDWSQYTFNLMWINLRKESFMQVGGNHSIHVNLLDHHWGRSTSLGSCLRERFRVALFFKGKYKTIKISFLHIILNRLISPLQTKKNHLQSNKTENSFPFMIGNTES